MIVVASVGCSVLYLVAAWACHLGSSDDFGYVAVLWMSCGPGVTTVAESVDLYVVDVAMYCAWSRAFVISSGGAELSAE